MMRSGSGTKVQYPRPFRYTDLDEYLVFGFIRGIQQKLSYQIPQPIEFICLQYFVIMEEFNKIGSNAQLSHNKCTITNTFARACTAYGSTLIHSNKPTIHKWKFKINFINHIYINIGITDDNEQWMELDERFYVNTQRFNHSYQANGWKCKQGRYDQYGQTYGANDTVEMILDLSTGHLSYSVNNIDQGIAYKIKQHDNIQYRLAVFTWDQGDSVTLIDYNSYKCKQKREKIDYINLFTAHSTSMIHQFQYLSYNDNIVSQKESFQCMGTIFILQDKIWIEIGLGLIHFVFDLQTFALRLFI
eukprot:107246_1